MKTFRVCATFTERLYYVVEAEDEEAAKALVLEGDQEPVDGAASELDDVEVVEEIA